MIEQKYIQYMYGLFEELPPLVKIVLGDVLHYHFQKKVFCPLFSSWILSLIVCYDKAVIMMMKMITKLFERSSMRLEPFLPFFSLFKLFNSVPRTCPAGLPFSLWWGCRWIEVQFGTKSKKQTMWHQELKMYNLAPRVKNWQFVTKREKTDNLALGV